MSIPFYRCLFFTGKQSRAELLHLSQIASRCPADVVAEAILKLFTYDATSSLHQISVPCLIITAVQDRIVLPRAGHYLHAKIKNSVLVKVRGGHQSMVEFPDDSIHVLQNFLSERNRC